MTSRVGNSIFGLHSAHPVTLLPEIPRVDDLRQVYHGFHTIYKRHVEDARFDVVKGYGFKFLKRRLACICYFLREHRDISPKKRTKLIDALLSEDDLRHAQKLISKSVKDKEHGKSSWFSFPKVTDEESLRKVMTKIANDVSDSDFLRRLKSVQDEELKNALGEAVALACAQLSSSIDATVNKLTHAVLRMQQEECKKRIQRQIEDKERKVLGRTRVNFIRDINRNSIGRRTS